MKALNELQLAKELIKFPSITPTDAGVMKFLEKKLKKLGFKTKILELKEKNFKPVKNLYARFGSKEPNFCYAGHLDVVPPGNMKDWTINPFKPSVKKGHLIGRGANDMKSSIASFVSAVSKFLSKNKKFNGSLRDEQKILKREALDHLNKYGSTIIAANTGFGKTCTSIYIATKIKMKTIVITHRVVLVNQWKKNGLYSHLMKFQNYTKYLVKSLKKNIQNMSLKLNLET